MVWIKLSNNEKIYSYGKILNKEIRNFIKNKYNNTCQHCKKQYPFINEFGEIIPFEVHHKTPKCLKGEDRIENLLLLCRPCHRKIYHSGKNSVSNLHKEIYNGI